MGFDVVSVGELKRALKAGATANKIVFSGVGKSAADLAFAAEQKIYSINIESHQEIELLKNLLQTIQESLSGLIQTWPQIPIHTLKPENQIVNLVF